MVVKSAGMGTWVTKRIELVGPAMADRVRAEANDRATRRRIIFVYGWVWLKCLTDNPTVLTVTCASEAQTMPSNGSQSGTRLLPRQILVFVMESVIEFDSAHLCRHGRSALPCPPDVG